MLAELPYSEVASAMISPDCETKDGVFVSICLLHALIESGNKNTALNFDTD